MKERYDIRFDGCRLQAETIERAKEIKSELEKWIIDANGNKSRFRDVIIIDMVTGKQID